MSSKLLRRIIGADNYMNSIGYAARLFKSAYRPYNEHGITLIAGMLPKGGVALDIGANMGRFTLILAKLVGNKGAIYSFEPLIYPRRIMRHVKALRGLDWVEVLPIALSDTPGKAVMNIPLKDGNKPQPALASLGVSKRDNMMHEDVTVDTLDRFAAEKTLTRLDFIKCDVEGFEYQLFNGGLQTLVRFKPIIFCEVMVDHYTNQPRGPKDFMDFMHAQGYRAYYPDANETGLHLLEDYSSITGKHDYFFIHTDSDKTHINLL